MATADSTGEITAALPQPALSALQSIWDKFEDWKNFLKPQQ